ncbi:methionine ABC transporter permease [Bacillus benzoevorans]|uniref:D-methionine transport system permease protein n=1 Tax=Bacillus benzoevorans TaxID=1456 RepID=A0A7X0HP35_9BACI|nr:methionine ABC transporter permease [Bacillus benzoevorans]MBB6444258.1 D-methionine transport system permease protein [Bacillus benzoevorans]
MLDNVIAVWPEILTALGQTFYMMIITLSVAVAVGTPLGTLLYIIRPGSVNSAPKLYAVIDGIINLIRSFPFLILLIAIIPFTRFIVGTAIGTTAVVVPLAISAIPEFARLIELTLLEVNRGVVEAAESMGANTRQIIWKVLYSEARSGIANALTIISVSFLSFSTVAGLVGGGGIGDFAIRYGYYRYQVDIMAATVILIIIIVQILQMTGNFAVRKLNKRL